jgi:hypothetical protein
MYIRMYIYINTYVYYIYIDVPGPVGPRYAQRFRHRQNPKSSSSYSIMLGCSRNSRKQGS